MKDKPIIVTMNGYTGTVTKMHNIVVCGKDTKVWDVDWHDSPKHQPLKLKDELGSDKEGYDCKSFTSIRF